VFRFTFTHQSVKDGNNAPNFGSFTFIINKLGIRGVFGNTVRHKFCIKWSFQYLDLCNSFCGSYRGS